MDAFLKFPAWSNTCQCYAMHLAPFITRANCRGSLHIRVRIYSRTVSKIDTIIRTLLVNVKPRSCRIVLKQKKYHLWMHCQLFFFLPRAVTRFNTSSSTKRFVLSSSRGLYVSGKITAHRYANTMSVYESRRGLYVPYCRVIRTHSLTEGDAAETSVSLPAQHGNWKNR